MYDALNSIDHLMMVAVSPWVENRMVQSRIAKYFLHVTSYFSDQKADLKGGWYVIQLAKRLQDWDVLFLVAGNTNISNVSDLPDNIVLLGSISKQEILADLYNIAEVNIITSQRETFGMTCAESLCCGTLVIGFKNGGSDSIALEEGTVFVDYG